MGMRVVLMVPSLRTSTQIPEGRGLLRDGSGERGFFPFSFLFCFFFFFFPWFSPLFFFLVCWAVIVDTEGGDAWLDRMGWDGMGWDGMGWDGMGIV